jgi:hypothetical protein
MSLLSRSRRPGHMLEWKVRMFTVGAVAAMAGIYFEERWMTGSAIVVLIAGALLGLLPRRDSGDPEDAEDSLAVEQDSGA